MLKKQDFLLCFFMEISLLLELFLFQLYEGVEDTVVDLVKEDARQASRHIHPV